MTIYRYFLWHVYCINFAIFFFLGFIEFATDQFISFWLFENTSLSFSHRHKLSLLLSAICFLSYILCCYGLIREGRVLFIAIYFLFFFANLRLKYLSSLIAWCVETSHSDLAFFSLVFPTHSTYIHFCSIYKFADLASPFAILLSNIGLKANSKTFQQFFFFFIR